MRAITPALLHALARGGSPSLMAALAPILARGMPPAAIDTPLRAAHFLAQGCHETFPSRGLKRISPTAPRASRRCGRSSHRVHPRSRSSEKLGNAAYAGSNGNGGEESGDGWRYRGRGFFQLTGRANYALAGAVGDPIRLRRRKARHERARLLARPRHRSGGGRRRRHARHALGERRRERRHRARPPHTPRLALLGS